MLPRRAFSARRMSSRALRLYALTRRTAGLRFSGRLLSVFSSCIATQSCTLHSEWRRVQDVGHRLVCERLWVTKTKLVQSGLRSYILLLILAAHVLVVLPPCRLENISRQGWHSIPQPSGPTLFATQLRLAQAFSRGVLNCNHAPSSARRMLECWHPGQAVRFHQLVISKCDFVCSSPPNAAACGHEQGRHNYVPGVWEPHDHP